MWLSNGVISASTDTVWWKQVRDTRIVYDLEHEPERFSKGQLRNMRRWMKLGYCDAPKGDAGSSWRLLMYKMKAHYLMWVYPAQVRIQFMTRNGVEYPTMLDEINLRTKLYANSASWKRPQMGDYFVFDDARTRHVWKIGDAVEGPRIRTNHSSYHDSCCLRSHPHLLAAIVGILGHPLGSDNIKKECLPLTTQTVRAIARTSEVGTPGEHNYAGETTVTFEE